MRELTLEIPLFENTVSDKMSASLLSELLRHVVTTYFFRIRSEGFLMICMLPSKELDLLKPQLANQPQIIQVKVLNSEKGGNDLLQVSGTWQALIKDKAYADKVIQFMKTAEKKQIYISRNPSFDGKKLRVSLVVEEKAITSLLEEMKSANIPFEVISLQSTGTRGESPLSDLTARQASILRLAHSMGYYDVPKKVGLEGLARLLGMEKGTVGEHLRRAEKHVFDRLLP